MGWLTVARSPPPGCLPVVRGPVHRGLEALPASLGLSFYLCLPGTAKRATGCLSLSLQPLRSPLPTPLTSIPKHRSGRRRKGRLCQSSSGPGPPQGQAGWSTQPPNAAAHCYKLSLGLRAPTCPLWRRCDQG